MANDKKQEKITREQAVLQGKRKYFTGEKCKRGHVAERATLSATCLECGRAAQADFRARLREKLARAEAIIAAAEASTR